MGGEPFEPVRRGDACASRPDDHPCGECLAASWLLGRLGGHLEVLPARARPVGILGADPEKLIAAVGGRRSGQLRAGLRSFDPNEARQRIASASLVAACRHGGAFPWPDALRGDQEPPAVLHVAGDPSLLDSPAVAIVGARKADGYGRGVAADIATGLSSAGITVVSGMALGIDGAAHRGALRGSRGGTVAVLGGGADVAYPRSHRALHDEIAASGAVVSELPPGTGVWRWSFPARNRIIAALSRLVVVVQAANGSGSLHTADAALERGIEVGAVPGPVTSRLCAGSNRLLAAGANVITGPDDAISVLGWRRGPVDLSVPEELADVFGMVIGGRAIPLDADGARAGEIMAKLTRLELIGLVRRSESGEWVAAGATRAL